MSSDVICVSNLSNIDIKAEYVGLSLEGDNDQKHIGIYFFNSEKEINQRLHLCWHMKLKNELCDKAGSFLAFPIKLDIWAKEFLADYCVDLAEKNIDGNIPYGFGFDGKYFDLEGNFIRLDSKDGLTCATFILALIDGSSLPLPIQVNTWLERESDKEWAENIVKYLKSPYISEEYYNEQCEKLKTAVRFRPEEIAIATSQEPKEWPLNFEQTIHLAEETTKLFNKCNIQNGYA